MRPSIIATILLLLGHATAIAQTPTSPPASPPASPPTSPSPSAEPSTPAGKRFPQPVRVGDLMGRQLLQPIEAQPVLGRVEGVTRQTDGTLDLLVRIGGVLGIGTRSVAVPVDAVALLGQYVALMDLKPDQLQALPTAAGSGARLGPDEHIRVGLVRPFH